VIDNGPNAASAGDVEVLTDSLGYVMSQGSAFLLDADNPSSFDFPAKYVVLNFDTPPPLARSATFVPSTSAPPKRGPFGPAGVRRHAPTVSEPFATRQE
jgi:hypothetical protein